MALLRGAALGDLPIGAGPFPAATLLPAALAGLEQSHPALRVTLQIDHTAVLCDLLVADRIELFVADTRDAARRDDLVLRRLAVQSGAMFCRAAHPLARRRRLAMADLAEQRFASVHLPAALRESLLRMMRPEGEACWALTCDNVYLLKDLARRNDVVLLCTEESLAAELASGEFVRLPVTDLRPMPVTIGLFTRAGRTMSPAAVLLAARLLEQAKRGRVTA
jgi:DNA-binding transcriptional LysR family regulator